MKIDEIEKLLVAKPKRWLVTGVAGFIGSNILQRLLELEQEVIGVDNLSTGFEKNLEDVKRVVGDSKFKNFKFVNGDVSSLEVCQNVCAGVDVVLHQAALGSVPRSIEAPLDTDSANVHGFVALSFAAKNASVKRIVYASSSSVYGDNQDRVKVEDKTGKLLSPYAVSKFTDELYAGVFSDLYGLEFVGLRYFNVFGPRQDPNGAYAAVVPRWIQLLLSGGRCSIYGDGLTSRDFCYIKNVVQANILAATVPDLKTSVFNVACGDSTTLLELHKYLVEGVTKLGIKVANETPLMEPFRVGDIRNSLASIESSKKYLGYEATHTVTEGLLETVSWYAKK